jgi:hypothetical protein
MQLVNTRVLGTLDCPKQWKMLVGKNYDSVLKLSLSNKKTRRFVSEIDVLIDYIFWHPEDVEKREVWHYLIGQYCKVMDILLVRSKFMDQNIVDFRQKIDDFCCYVEQSGAGKEGLMDYLHMLASGYIKYYMQVHRNLYKYFQQGWES